MKEGIPYVVNRKTPTGDVFVALVRARSRAQAISHVVNGEYTAHAASANEVAAFMHHKGIQNAMQQDTENQEGSDG